MGHTFDSGGLGLNVPRVFGRPSPHCARPAEGLLGLPTMSHSSRESARRRIPPTKTYLCSNCRTDRPLLPGHVEERHRARRPFGTIPAGPLPSASTQWPRRPV